MKRKITLPKFLEKLSCLFQFEKHNQRLMTGQGMWCVLPIRHVFFTGKAATSGVASACQPFVCPRFGLSGYIEAWSRLLRLYVWKQIINIMI